MLTTLIILYALVCTYAVMSQFSWMDDEAKHKNTLAMPKSRDVGLPRPRNYARICTGRWAIVDPANQSKKLKCFQCPKETSYTGSF